MSLLSQINFALETLTKGLCYEYSSNTYNFNNKTTPTDDFLRMMLMLDELVEQNDVSEFVICPVGWKTFTGITTGSVKFVCVPRDEYEKFWISSGFEPKEFLTNENHTKQERIIGDEYESIFRDWGVPLETPLITRQLPTKIIYRNKSNGFSFYTTLTKFDFVDFD